MSRKKSDREVGFGKPPVEHQFKKGQSGNPAGRPKKTKAPPVDLADLPIATAMHAELQRTFTITEAGETKEINLLQALQKKRVQMALGGNRLVGERLLDELKALEEEAFESRMREFRHLQDLKAEGERKLEEAKAKGWPAPLLIPHPDDIKIDDTNLRASVQGPQNEADQRRVEHLEQLRTTLAHLAAQQRRACGVIEPTLESWEVWAHIVDTWLPPRLRLSVHEWVGLHMRLDVPTKRELAVLTAQEIDRLGELHGRLPPLSPQAHAICAGIWKQFEAGFRGARR